MFPEQRTLRVTTDDNPQALVGKLGTITAGTGPVAITLDLSRYERARVGGLTLMTAAVRSLDVTGRLKSIRCVHPANPDVHNYVSRVDFYSHIGCPVEEQFRRHDPTGAFVELKRIDEGNSTAVIDQIATVIRHKTSGWDPRLFGSANYSLGEVADNACAHSLSPFGAYVLAQNYYNCIEISVVDCGIGVPNALRTVRDYSKLSDMEALENALRDGVTSKPDRGRGAGLYTASELVKGSGGRFVMYSGGAMLVSTVDGTTVMEAPVWPGTFLHLRFGKDYVPDINAIFRGNIPATIQDEVDEALADWF